MKKSLIAAVAILALSAVSASAQYPVPRQTSYAMTVAEKANLQIAHDFWRDIMLGGTLDIASHYMPADFISRNPNVAAGRDAFVKVLQERPSLFQNTARQRAGTPEVEFAKNDYVFFMWANFVVNPIEPRVACRRYRCRARLSLRLERERHPRVGAETREQRRQSGRERVADEIAHGVQYAVDAQELLDTRPFASAWHHHILNDRSLYGLPRKFNVGFDGGGIIPVLEDTNDIAFTAVTVHDGAGVEAGVWFRLGIGGITGALLTAVFCDPSLGGTGVYDYVANAVAPYSISAQFIAQLWAVGVTIVWSGVVSIAAFWLVKVTIGLRVSEDQEREGLDTVSHGESAYT